MAAHFSALQSHLRHLTEEGLSGPLFEVALDRLPACVAYADKERRYRYVNARFQEVLRLPLDQIIGRTVEDVVGTENYRAIEPAIARALAGRETEFEAPFELPTMGTRQAHFKYIPHLDDAGRSQGYFVIVTDLTGAKEATEGLRERERQIRLLSADQPIMITYCDAHGRYLYVNAVFTEWFGLTSDQVMGRHWAEVVGATNQTAIAPQITQAYRGRRVEFQDRLVLPDGRAHHMRGVYVPHKEGENIIGVFTLRQDVSKLQDAIDALLASDGKDGLPDDDLPAAICYVDAEERYRFANRRFQEWYAPDGKAFIGKTAAEVLPPEFYEVVRARSQRVFRGETVDYSDVLALASGRELLSRVTYVPHLAAGEVEGFVLVRTDVTALRGVEAELAHITTYDALTGLANARHFRDRFAYASRLGTRDSCALCVIRLKLEGLQAINRDEGRHAGDHVLVAVADHLRRACGQGTMPARTGMDEFAVLIDGEPSIASGAALAAKIAEAADAPVTFGKSALRVKARMGITLADRFATNADGALAMAGEALRAAARLGEDFAVYGVRDLGAHAGASTSARRAR